MKGREGGVVSSQGQLCLQAGTVRGSQCLARHLVITLWIFVNMLLPHTIQCHYTHLDVLVDGWQVRPQVEWEIMGCLTTPTNMDHTLMTAIDPDKI